MVVDNLDGCGMTVATVRERISPASTIGASIYGRSRASHRLRGRRLVLDFLPLSTLHGARLLCT